MLVKDPINGYSWLSIALHWVSAIIIIVLWFIGNTMMAQTTADPEPLIRLHVSIAASCYLLLWLRVLWRLYCGHPEPLPSQQGISFRIGKFTHYFLLIAISLMLVSGPLLVWAGGNSIGVFNLFSIPGPFGMHLEMQKFFTAVHHTTSTVVIILVLLHILGTFKHIIFNRDGTFDKIMIAGRDPDGSD